MSEPATQTPAKRCRTIGKVALFLLGCAIILAAIAPLAREVSAPFTTLFIGTLTSVVTLVLTVLFTRWDGLRLDQVGASPVPRTLPRFAFGFLIGLLLVALSTMITAALGPIYWIRGSSIPVSTVLIMLLGYLGLACREELAFHGYPLIRLYQTFGLWPAQLTIALVFAFEHKLGGWTWTQALLGAAIGSLLFAMAAIATRGLAVPIGLHTAWNFADWLRGGKDSPGLWKPVIQPHNQPRVQLIATASYLAVMLLATFAFWLYHRRALGNTNPPTTSSAPPQPH